MKKILTSVCGLFCLIFLLFSCKTVGVLAAVVGIVGEIAGIEGSVEMAESIMTSAESIEKAIEKIDPAQEYYIGRAVTLLSETRIFFFVKDDSLIQPKTEELPVN